MSDAPYAADPLKVRGDTNVGSFSKSLRMTLAENGGKAVVRAMGPHAVSTAVKGLIAAQRDLASQGKRLRYTHAFSTSMEDGNEITAIQTLCTVEDLD